MRKNVLLYETIIKKNDLENSFDEEYKDVSKNLIRKANLDKNGFKWKKKLKVMN